MSAIWSGAGGLALGLVVALEVLFLVLRKRAPRFRPRALYHAWVASLALLVVLHRLPLESARTWPIATTVALVLSSLVLFALLDALVLQRPWNETRGPYLPKLARDVLRLGLLLGVGLYAATVILEQPVGPLLVSSTVLSAVVGLALQDTLKNVFSGIAIDLEKPFQRGDWLLIDGRTRAQVIDMSWRSTHLRTQEGLAIYEPNANLSVSRVVNYGSGSEPIAVEIRVGLPYDAPPAEVKEVLLEAAASAPGSLDRPPPRVFLESYGDHAITYFLRVWTRRIANLTGFEDGVNTRIWYALRRRGIEIPFPIRTVHLHEAPDMERQRRATAEAKAFELFSEIDIFSRLDGELVHRLAAAADRRLFDTGETLVREGAQGDSLFLIERGSVRVTRPDPDRADRVVDLAVLPEGAFFGEMSLLTGEPRSATVLAREPCSVLSLGKEALAPILAQDPRIAEELSRAVVARQAENLVTVEERRSGDAAESLQSQERSLLGRIHAFFALA